MYIHEQKDWPNFIWNNDELFDIITKVSFKQGELLGKMQSLGFDFRQEALLNNLTEEITKSSEIEGELLNKDEVRSSIAKRLNIHNTKPINSSHHIDGMVEIMIDATHNFDTALTYERLCGWHAALFPTGYSGMYKIKTACYRDDKDGPMQVVSNNKGREIVYYEAPQAILIEKYMDDFFGDKSDKYRYKHIVDAVSFIPYGTIVDEFQHIVYENPELSPEERKAEYLKLEEKYRPYLSFSGIPYLEKGTRWQYQMHIYESPFYYIDYCLAQCVAFGFLVLSRENFDSALEKYVDFLKSTGGISFSELVENADMVSPFKAGSLKRIAQGISQVIIDLEKEI